MSLGRLLATGKSLVGLNGGTGRYRVSNPALLPKFISPKNPFTAEAPPAKSPVTEQLSEPPTAPKSVVAAAPVAADQAGKNFSRLLMGTRAVCWLGAWGQKLDPRPRRWRLPDPLKSVAQQGELSLDAVRVVRNDLSDTDFEVVRPVDAKPGLPRMARTAEKLEPVGAAWQRLTTRFFGDPP